MTKLEDRPSSMPDPNEFTAEGADIDPKVELRSAFSEALSQNGFPDTLVLSRTRADAVFDQRRLEIIDYLTENDPSSVRSLADALGHDKGVVSRDLQDLAEIDIIEYVSDGRAKAPRLKHEHLAVEPVF